MVHQEGVSTCAVATRRMSCVVIFFSRLLSQLRLTPPPATKKKRGFWQRSGGFLRKKLRRLSAVRGQLDLRVAGQLLRSLGRGVQHRGDRPRRRALVSQVFSTTCPLLVAFPLKHGPLGSLVLPESQLPTQVAHLV